VGNIARLFRWIDRSDIRTKLFSLNPLVLEEIDPSLFGRLQKNGKFLFLVSQ
jgi:hypothetical protein